MVDKAVETPICPPHPKQIAMGPSQSQNILKDMSTFFQVVFNWGCSKDSGQNILEYLNQCKEHSNNVLRKRFRIEQKDRKKLESSTSCNDFDVTLLYKLILAACEDIAPSDTEAWNPSENTLESNLLKLKNIRNSIAHSSFDEVTTEDTIEHIKKMLTAAGKKYSIDADDVQKEIERVDVVFSEPVKDGEFDDISSRDQHQTRLFELETIRKDLIEKGNEESRLTLEKTCMKITIPFGENQREDVQLKAILHQTSLCYFPKCIGGDVDSLPETFCHTNLLERWSNDDSEDSDIIIMEGESGFGKSTFCKTLALDYHNSSHQISGLNQFQLLIFYEGHDQTVESLKELVKRSYPKTLSGVHSDEAKEAIMELKTLYVIDGLDQMNKYSSRVVKEMVQHSKIGKATLICTTRPYASEDFQQDLKEQGVLFRVCQFKAIENSQEQEKFYLRYRKAMAPANEDPKTVLTNFRNAQINLFYQLMIPINLVLLCSLQTFDSFNDQQWNQSLLLYQGFLYFLKQRFLQRVRHQTILNVGTNLEKVLSKIYNDALERVKRGVVQLDINEYKSLKETCSEVCNEFPIEELFSSLFQRRNANRFNDQMTYQYPHQSFMEFYASLALLEKLSKTEQPIKNILPEITRKQCCKRYTGVLLFCLYQMCDHASEAQQLKTRAREIIKRLPKEKHAGNLLMAKLILTGCKFHPIIFDLLNEKFIQGGVMTVQISSGADLWLWDTSQMLDVQQDALQKYMMPPFGTRFSTTVVKCGLRTGFGKKVSKNLGRRNLFRISLRNPESHSLSKLEEKKIYFLEVSVLFPSPPPSSHRPLPRARFLRLTLLGVGKEGADWAQQMVQQLAPKNSKYDSLQLLDCHLPTEEKNSLLSKLKSKTHDLEYKEANEETKQKSRKRFRTAAMKIIFLGLLVLPIGLSLISFRLHRNLLG